MKYFVFGANGFIGSNLIISLSDSARLFDNAFLKKPVNPRIENLCISKDINTIRNIFRNEQEDFIVINLAAIHYIPYCEQNPADTFKTNVLGNMLLAEAVLGTNCRKFMFASSGAVYKPSKDVHTEDSKLQSSDIYSASKLSAERDLKDIFKTEEIDVDILRLFNVVGPHDFTPHIIPEFYDQIVSTSDIIRHGNLSTIRDYVHVDDVCSAILLLSKAEFRNSTEIFNVCTGIGHSGISVLAELKKISKIMKPSVIDENKLRKSDRPSQIGSNDLLSRCCGWFPHKTFEEGLLDYVNFRKI